MLVLMALVTTFATTPILHLITRNQPLEEEQASPFVRAESPRWDIERSAVLVPVSNPLGVNRLVELALSATPADAPPPRVLALVRPPIGGVRSGLREVEQRIAPRSPALSAALDLAWSRGAVITPQAVWSSDPVADILRTAGEPQNRLDPFGTPSSGLRAGFQRRRGTRDYGQGARPAGQYRSDNSGRRDAI